MIGNIRAAKKPKLDPARGVSTNLGESNVSPNHSTGDGPLVNLPPDMISEVIVRLDDPRDFFISCSKLSSTKIKSIGFNSEPFSELTTFKLSCKIMDQIVTHLLSKPDEILCFVESARESSNPIVQAKIAYVMAGICGDVNSLELFKEGRGIELLVEMANTCEAQFVRQATVYAISKIYTERNISWKGCG